MQRSLKLKLQNALNQAFVETGSPAIFVGGRRHNRKKRKNKNGQNKKKNKKTGVVSGPVLPKTPDFALYEAELARYAEPKVSCLDIKEPEFAEHPVKCRLKDEDRDSMYNSSDSLSSYSSDQNGTQQTTETNVTEEEHESTVPQKTGLPRLHSEDSGVFDDDDDNEDYDEDVGFCDDITVEYDVVNNDERSIQDELSEVAVGDNEVETEDCSLVIVNDVEPADDNQDVTVTHEHITETNDETEIVDELEKVSVETETVLGNDQKDSSIDDENEAALLNINEEENNGSNPNKFLEETDPFLKFANYPDDEEEIVFDLSQLEVNNIDEISKTKDTIQQSIEDQEVPTVLEEEIPLTVPLDLLIDNDDNDDVLYEAKNRKELSITCNPLYEYTVMEEEDKLSIKSYQSGFKTDFDNINLIQIPVPASDKAAHKSLKESTPLMKRQPIWGDRDDELACCVIL